MRIELAGADGLDQECVIFRAGDVNGAAKIPGFDNGTSPVHRAFEPIGADGWTTREDRLGYGSQVLCLVPTRRSNTSFGRVKGVDIA